MKHKKWILIAVMAAFAFLSCENLNIAEIHVSPEGNNSNPGTSNQALATIGAARDMVRVLRSQGKKGNIEVLIHGGTYYLDQTIFFKPEDNAPVG
jgi:hypothetical protein